MRGFVGLELILLTLRTVIGELELPLALSRLVLAAIATERGCKGNPKVLADLS